MAIPHNLVLASAVVVQRQVVGEEGQPYHQDCFELGAEVQTHIQTASVAA